MKVFGLIGTGDMVLGSVLIVNCKHVMLATISIRVNGGCLFSCLDVEDSVWI